MSIIQYFKDTQGELRHVAWPTRAQTIVFTVLVAFVSVAVALYLGLFDYIFTTTLGRVLETLPSSGALSPDQVPASHSGVQIPTETTAGFTPIDVETSTQ